MSEAKVEYRHHDKATELVSRIAHPIDSRGAEAARQYNRTLLAQALANAESAQPAERAGEWVSVEERLPEHAQSVLFWGKGWVKGAVFGLGRFMTDEDGLRLFEDETQQEDDGPRMYPTDEVTHWMPLPPPPQPKEKP